jgi:hypothetical protein
MVGLDNAGKTSILHYLRHSIEAPRQKVPTIGFAIERATFGGCEIQVSFLALCLFLPHSCSYSMFTMLPLTMLSLIMLSLAMLPLVMPSLIMRSLVMLSLA